MPERTPDLRSLVAGAARLLAEAGVSSPQHDARALAAHALGRPRLDVLGGVELPSGFGEAYAGYVERRRQREPLQHILGHTTFRHLTLTVGPGVFVPRPETEVVAQAAIDEAVRLAAAGREPLVVDLCCGAGGIALSVDVEAPSSRVVAVDLSPEAVGLTRRNNGDVGGGTMRIEQGDVRHADLLEDLNGAVDVVVANPPYIPPDAVPVEVEVRDHDPDLALYGGGVDGLDVPRAVIAAAARLLRPGGLFVMEHADSQGPGVRAAARVRGEFEQERTIPDLTGRARALVARRS